MLFLRAVFHIELGVERLRVQIQGGGVFHRQDSVETGLKMKKAARSEEPIFTPDGGEFVRYRDCPF